MKSKINLAILLMVLGALLTAPYGHAQESETETSDETTEEDSGTQGQKLKSWNVNLAGGVIHPYTDISYKQFWGVSKPENEHQFGGYIGVTKLLSGAFGLQARFLYGKVQGVVDGDIKTKEDEKYVIDLFKSSYPQHWTLFRDNVNGAVFNSTMMEGSINFYWNISNTIFGLNRMYKAIEKGEEIKERKLSFYSTVGIGLNRFDSELELIPQAGQDLPFGGDTLTYLNGRQIDPTTEVVIPFGIGLKYNVHKMIDIGLEYNYNLLLSDKLDLWDFNHPNRPKNDAYTMLGLTITLKLGGKKTQDKSIEWVNPTEGLYDEMKAMNETFDEMSKDSDEDGVSDFFDKEDDTPAGAKVDGSGVAHDNDYDGIPDHEDEELFSDKGATVDETGKAKDSDDDGVPYHRDLEPNTPPGTVVNFEGISLGDALEIKETQAVTGGGAPYPSVFFDFDKSTIKREYKLRIYALARTMLENPSVKVKLTGHADARGTEAYNEKLSLNRAEAVKNFLVENFGIDGNRITVQSIGEENPVSKIHEINRRVDIFIVE